MDILYEVDFDLGLVFVTDHNIYKTISIALFKIPAIGIVVYLQRGIIGE